MLADTPASIRARISQLSLTLDILTLLLDIICPKLRPVCKSLHCNRGTCLYVQPKLQSCAKCAECNDDDAFFFKTNLWFYGADLINLNFAHQTLNLTKSIVNVGPEMPGFSLCVCLDRCGWVMISKFLTLLSGESTAVQQQREGADAWADRHHASIQSLLQAGPHSRGTVHLHAGAVSTRTRTHTWLDSTVHWTHAELMCVWGVLKVTALVHTVVLCMEA